MNKTEWLDWLDAGRSRLHSRYRELMRRAWGEPVQGEPVVELPRWSAIRADVDRQARGVVVHVTLPEPHTVEAAVRVIDSTLAIAVLRTGADIERAPVENCYRRAIPLPARVDPESATHQIDGDELVIRLRHREPDSHGSRRRSAAGN